MLKLSLLAFMICTSVARADLTTDKQLIDSDCKKDATTAGCKDMTMGHGLAKCLFAYKQKNPKFALSTKCKQDMASFRKDKAQYRRAKKDPAVKAAATGTPPPPAVAPAKPAPGK